MEFHEVHRLGAHGWVRSIIGSLTVLGTLVFLGPAVVGLLFVVGIEVTGGDRPDGGLLDTDNVTPLGLAYAFTALAVLIPVVLVVTRVVHKLPPGWSSSVLPRIRWRWLAACFGVSLVAMVVTLCFSAGLPIPVEGGGETLKPRPFTDTTRDFLLIILLLTPLQAAGEEYAFRGYLTQAFGGLVRGRWFAVLVPALLFALAHGSQELPIFIDRLGFGLVAGVVVIITGGLEAGIAMHVLNNFAALGLAVGFGDLEAALQPTDGTWWSVPVTLVRSLVFLGLVVWMARQWGLRTTVERGVLEGSAHSV